MPCHRYLTRLLGRPRFGLAVALLGLCAGLAVAERPANAGKVGVAAAVNPDAFSSLSGVPNKQLNIGKSIFFNERIKTTTSGLVQVLLVDGSTFTVGPNSNLVIDKFVYDPKKKSGELVATFSKGSMRFIGGKLSKNAGGVKVNTPSGALAIRGGMFQGNVERRIYSFLYGHSLTFTGRNGRRQTVYQSGYTLDLSSGRPNVRPTTAEDTNVFMQALSSGGGSNSAGNGSGGDQGGQQAAQNTGQQAANISNAASQAVSDATFVQVQTAIAEQLMNLEKLKTETENPQPTNTTPDTNPPANDGGSDGGPPPVVKNGGKFAGFASGFLQTGEDGTGRPLPLLGGRSKIALDPEANSVTGKIRVFGLNWGGPGPDEPNVESSLDRPSGSFGGIGEELSFTRFSLGFLGEGDSAYIDDNTFLALGDDGTTTVTHRPPWGGDGPGDDSMYSANSEVASHLIEGGPPNEPPGVSHDGALFSLPSTALCKDCDFLKFGAWASDVTYGQRTAKMGGWWIATDDPVKSAGDLPQQGSAYYGGNAVGTFAKRDDGVWRQGVANGQLGLDWDFADRKGTLKISDFGNRELGRKSFGGTVRSPGEAVGFGGIIEGGGGIGLARGTFVGPRGGAAPKGVMGDFGIVGRNWGANGVFGGKNGPGPVSGNY